MNSLPTVLSADLLARRAAQGEVLVVYDSPWAFVFDDDGEVCLNAYRRSGDDYELMFDQIDSGLPNDRPPFHGGWFLVPVLAQGFAWRLGHTHQREVTIKYLGGTYSVPPDANGNWAFIRQTALDGPYDTPEVVAW